MTVPRCHSGQGAFQGAESKATRPALDTWTLASNWHLRSGEADQVVFVWPYTNITQHSLQFVQIQLIMKGFLD